MDDLNIPGLLHAAIVRSAHAHARIRAIRTDAARAVPGVVAVLTLADLPECTNAVPPLIGVSVLRPYHQPVLAGDETRHVGEAVAVVVAEDPYRAADGTHAVVVDYEPLPAAATVDAALAPDAPRVHAAWPSNDAGASVGDVGDVAAGFAAADVVVDGAFAVPRIAGTPIEPRGVVAEPAASDGRFTVWISTQVPFAVRAGIAGVLGMSEERVRVIAPDVGGGFGVKGHVYPEDLLIPAVAR
ncbi:MAG: xanthine dehydrogenase family protein molybdopterin-binding subunit, partial [Candidatus Rokubacteria bacterium]|nr:xanthine dehydrogenase family protein molybdopterin-binding subunit [Candidatus Rokubacteria bacterium]